MPPPPPQVRVIPGFYWDQGRKRYFRITQDHRPPPPPQPALVSSTSSKGTLGGQSCAKRKRIGTEQSVSNGDGTEVGRANHSVSPLYYLQKKGGITNAIKFQTILGSPQRFTVCNLLASSRSGPAGNIALPRAQNSRCVAADAAGRRLFWSDDTTLRCAPFAHLGENDAALHPFPSSITSLAYSDATSMLAASVLGGYDHEGSVYLLSRAGTLQVIRAPRKSCWTAAIGPTTTPQIAIGCSKSLCLASMVSGTMDRKYYTRSDPLALCWMDVNCLWIGQRDGFTHFVDFRVPSIHGRLPIVASSGSTRRDRLSPVSALVNLENDGPYVLHRSGSLAALVPGYGPVEVSRGLTGLCDAEHLLDPLGMVAGDACLTASQPLGRPMLRVRSQKVIDTVPIPCGDDFRHTCSDMASVSSSDWNTSSGLPLARFQAAESFTLSDSTRPTTPMLFADLFIGVHKGGIVFSC